MKFLKYLTLTLLMLLGIWCIWAAFLPAVCNIERSMIINADANTIFENVNTLKTWKQWSYWDNIDSTMKSEYSGAESGVGAIHKWESANENVGKGSLEITKSEPRQLVETKLIFEGMGEHMGGWKFRDTTGGVIVTSFMNMNNSFFFRPLMAIMGFEEMLGADFDKSLNGLKTLSESMPPKVAAIPMEESTLAPMKVITIKGSCSTEEVSQKLGAMYGQLMEFNKKNKIKQAGPVFAIYSNYDNGKFDIEAGAPVDVLPAKTEGDIKAYETAEMKTYKAVHMGPYSGLMNFHAGINTFLESKGADSKGPRWEIYISDPIPGSDSTQWETDIHVPF